MWGLFVLIQRTKRHTPCNGFIIFSNRTSFVAHADCSCTTRINMQGFLQAIRSYQEKLLGHSLLRSSTAMKNNLLRLGSISSYLTVEEGTRPAEESSPMQHKGLENVTVAEVLMTKGGEKAGSWLSCRADDTVYDAVKQMAQNNIGSLVVLKPGQQQLIAGILTERDYLRKVVVQDRSSKYTRVGEIMTDQDNLVTVTSDTNILHAMQLMTGNYSTD
ncbi:unnamed protein product [Coffea canephora]|uniref:CBS domain-containing protein n=1 Tax=Coffea canephora TaxID=49390 RepID=A0A068UG85_COFCA|nr:unnamed protein product [Coffea canephora]